MKESDKLYNFFKGTVDVKELGQFEQWSAGKRSEFTVEQLEAVMKCFSVDEEKIISPRDWQFTIMKAFPRSPARVLSNTFLYSGYAFCKGDWESLFEQWCDKFCPGFMDEVKKQRSESDFKSKMDHSPLYLIHSIGWLTTGNPHYWIDKNKEWQDFYWFVEDNNYMEEK